MDTPDTVHPDKDSTLAIGEAASNRNYDLFYTTVNDVYLNNEIPYANSVPFVFQRDIQTPLKFIGKSTSEPMDNFDYILMRKDPPYNMDYIFTTHILSLAKRAKVLNHPASLREAPEKIYPLKFPGIFPPTYIGKSKSMLLEFAEKHEDVILKPLDGNGGKGVLKTGLHDSNFYSICEILTQEYTQYTIIQKYLPEVEQGDKRIILLDGEPVGAIVRKNEGHDIRTNLHVGGQSQKTDLDEYDKELCAMIGSQLVKDGLYFVGIDVIGKYITEINVTSPTGIQEIKSWSNIDIADLFWEKLESPADLNLN